MSVLQGRLGIYFPRCSKLSRRPQINMCLDDLMENLFPNSYTYLLACFTFCLVDSNWVLKKKTVLIYGNSKPYLVYFFDWYLMLKLWCIYDLTGKILNMQHAYSITVDHNICLIWMRKILISLFQEFQEFPYHVHAYCNEVSWTKSKHLAL